MYTLCPPPSCIARSEGERHSSYKVSNECARVTKWIVREVTERVGVWITKYEFCFSLQPTVLFPVQTLGLVTRENTQQLEQPAYQSKGTSKTRENTQQLEQPSLGWMESQDEKYFLKCVAVLLSPVHAPFQECLWRLRTLPFCLILFTPFIFFCEPRHSLS